MNKKIIAILAILAILILVFSNPVFAACGAEEGFDENKWNQRDKIVCPGGRVPDSYNGRFTIQGGGGRISCHGTTVDLDVPSVTVSGNSFVLSGVTLTSASYVYKEGSEYFVDTGSIETANFKASGELITYESTASTLEASVATKITAGEANLVGTEVVFDIGATVIDMATAEAGTKVGELQFEGSTAHYDKDLFTLTSGKLRKGIMSADGLRLELTKTYLQADSASLVQFENPYPQITNARFELEGTSFTKADFYAQAAYTYKFPDGIEVQIPTAAQLESVQMGSDFDVIFDEMKTQSSFASLSSMFNQNPASFYDVSFAGSSNPLPGFSTLLNLPPDTSYANRHIVWDGKNKKVTAAKGATIVRGTFRAKSLSETSTFDYGEQESHFRGAWIVIPGASELLKTGDDAVLTVENNGNFDLQGSGFYSMPGAHFSVDIRGSLSAERAGARVNINAKKTNGMLRDESYLFGDFETLVEADGSAKKVTLLDGSLVNNNHKLKVETISKKPVDVYLKELSEQEIALVEQAGGRYVIPVFREANPNEEMEMELLRQINYLGAQIEKKYEPYTNVGMDMPVPLQQDIPELRPLLEEMEAKKRELAGLREQPAAKLGRGFVSLGEVRVTYGQYTHTGLESKTHFRLYEIPQNTELPYGEEEVAEIRDVPLMHTRLTGGSAMASIGTENPLNGEFKKRSDGSYSVVFDRQGLINLDRSDTLNAAYLMFFNEQDSDKESVAGITEFKDIMVSRSVTTGKDLYGRTFLMDENTVPSYSEFTSELLYEQALYEAIYSLKYRVEKGDLSVAGTLEEVLKAARRSYVDRLPGDFFDNLFESKAETERRIDELEVALTNPGLLPEDRENLNKELQTQKKYLDRLNNVQDYGEWKIGHVTGELLWLVEQDAALSPEERDKRKNEVYDDAKFEKAKLALSAGGKENIDLAAEITGDIQSREPDKANYLIGTYALLAQNYRAAKQAFDNIQDEALRAEAEVIFEDSQFELLKNMENEWETISEAWSDEYQKDVEEEIGFQWHDLNPAYWFGWDVLRREQKEIAAIYANSMYRGSTTLMGLQEEGYSLEEISKMNYKQRRELIRQEIEGDEKESSLLAHDLEMFLDNSPDGTMLRKARTGNFGDEELAQYYYEKGLEVYSRRWHGALEAVQLFEAAARGGNGDAEKKLKEITEWHLIFAPETTQDKWGDVGVDIFGDPLTWGTLGFAAVANVGKIPMVIRAAQAAEGASWATRAASPLARVAVGAFRTEAALTVRLANALEEFPALTKVGRAVSWLPEQLGLTREVAVGRYGLRFLPEEVSSARSAVRSAQTAARLRQVGASDDVVGFYARSARSQLDASIATLESWAYADDARNMEKVLTWREGIQGANLDDMARIGREVEQATRSLSPVPQVSPLKNAQATLQTLEAEMEIAQRNLGLAEDTATKKNWQRVVTQLQSRVVAQEQEIAAMEELSRRATQAAAETAAEGGNLERALGSVAVDGVNEEGVLRFIGIARTEQGYSYKGVQLSEKHVKKLVSQVSDPEMRNVVQEFGLSWALEGKTPELVYLTKIDGKEVKLPLKFVESLKLAPEQRAALGVSNNLYRRLAIFEGKPVARFGLAGEIIDDKEAWGMLNKVARNIRAEKGMTLMERLRARFRSASPVNEIAAASTTPAEARANLQAAAGAKEAEIAEMEGMYPLMRKELYAQRSLEWKPIQEGLVGGQPTVGQAIEAERAREFVSMQEKYLWEIAEEPRDYMLSFRHGTNSKALPGITGSGGRLSPFGKMLEGIEAGDFSAVPYGGELGRGAMETGISRDAISGMSFERAGKEIQYAEDFLTGWNPKAGKQKIGEFESLIKETRSALAQGELTETIAGRDIEYLEAKIIIENARIQKWKTLSSMEREFVENPFPMVITAEKEASPFFEAGGISGEVLISEDINFLTERVVVFTDEAHVPILKQYFMEKIGKTVDVRSLESYKSFDRILISYAPNGNKGRLALAWQDTARQQFAEELLEYVDYPVERAEEVFAIIFPEILAEQKPAVHEMIFELTRRGKSADEIIRELESYFTSSQAMPMAAGGVVAITGRATNLRLSQEDLKQLDLYVRMRRELLYGIIERPPELQELYDELALIESAIDYMEESIMMADMAGFSDEYIRLKRRADAVTGAVRRMWAGIPADAPMPAGYIAIGYFGGYTGMLTTKEIPEFVRASFYQPTKQLGVVYVSKADYPALTGLLAQLGEPLAVAVNPINLEDNTQEAVISAMVSE